MKAFVITALAVLVGIYIYSRVTGRTRKTVTYLDPQTGSKVTVDESSVTIKDGNIIFQGPDVDPITGAYTIPGAKAGTVGFMAQGN